VVEASQAGGAPHGSGAAVNVGGGSGGNPWETVVAALDKRQPEVAWREFMQLLEQGLAPPSNVCDRLIYGESRRIPPPHPIGTGLQPPQAKGCRLHVMCIRGDCLALPCVPAAALCGRQRFQEVWRMYSATSPAGHLLAYNTYQSLISLAIKVGRLCITRHHVETGSVAGAAGSYWVVTHGTQACDCC
jgi:hypothetical protein